MGRCKPSKGPDAQNQDLILTNLPTGHKYTID